MQWRGILAAGILLATGLPGHAQNVYAPAVRVNDSVVTFYDVDQRTRLLEALGARGDVRALAVEQLTEDRLKVEAASALGIELPEGALVTGIEEFAAQRGLSFDDVINVLVQREIDRQTMDDFVEAGLVWREVVQSRFRERAMPSETDLDLALEIQANTPVELIQLSEIALPFAERGEAETIAFADRLARDLARGGDFGAAARSFSRSGTAAQGGLLEPVPAMRLPPAIRTQVLLLEPGQVTRPVPISGGLAILRLNSIRQAPPAAASPDVTDEEARNLLREQLFGQRIESFGQGYLQELKRDALIVEE